MTVATEGRLSSRIVKGGALLGDARLLVEHWDSSLTADDNLAVLVERNVFAKRSQSRASDVVHHVLRPRLVEPGPHVVEALRAIVNRSQAFSEAIAYEAARADPLLGRFFGDALWGWWAEGRLALSVSDAEDWLAGLMTSRAIPSWSPALTTRVAHGLLATARDFGLIAGAAKKRLAPVSLSPTGFAYVAFRLREQGATSRGLVESEVWRWWLLGPDDVERQCARAARAGVFHLSRAGSMIRLDWEADTLVEVVRAAA